MPGKGRDGKRPEGMRGLKLSSTDNLISVNDSFHHFLVTRFGRKFPEQLMAVLNDILDTGDLHSLDDVKKVVRYYEWRERTLRLQADGYKEHINGLEAQLAALQAQFQGAQRGSALGQVPVARQVAGPTRVSTGSGPSTSPTSVAAIEAEVSEVEQRAPIKAIVSKITQVKSLSALSSDAEIDEIFSDLE